MKYLVKFNESYSTRDQIILSCADLLDYFDYEIRPGNKSFQIYFTFAEHQAQYFTFAEHQAQWDQITKDKRFVIRVPGIKSDGSNLGIFLGDGSSRCLPSTEKKVVDKLGDKGFYFDKMMDSCVKLLHSISPFSYLDNYEIKYKYSDLLFYTELKRELVNGQIDSIVLYYRVSIVLSDSLVRYGTSSNSYYGED